MEVKDTGLVVEFGEFIDTIARNAVWHGCHAVIAAAAPYEADPPPAANSDHQAAYFLRQWASMWRLPTKEEKESLGLEDVWHAGGGTERWLQGRHRLILVRGVQWWEYRLKYGAGGRWEPARIGTPGCPNDPEHVVRCSINEKNEEVEVCRG